MYTLGINISHHCSVCLLKDGDIVFYLEEERVSKIKTHNLYYIIEDFFGKPITTEDLKNNIRLKCLTTILKFTKKIDHVIFSSFGGITDTFIINLLLEQLRETFQISEIHFYQEHHLYHASSAFYNSGFDRAVSIVLDGGGFRYTTHDEIGYYEIESIYVADYQKINQVTKHFSSFMNNPENNNIPNFVSKKEENFFSNTLSCGGIFNLISGIIGFDGSSAGKTMGLAAYGRSENVTEQWFDQDNTTGLWITNIDEITRSLKQRFNFTENLVMLTEPTGISRVEENIAADLAKKAQIETRDHTIRLIDKFTKLTGEKNVVLSGGYFLNCSNNYEYLKRFPDLNFFVDPIAHDGGTAIGAAKYLWHKLTGDKTIRSLKTLYLGE
jgi:carbamoyltransferase